jgi:ABC-2 type transport system ATP-binding protein
MSAPAIEVKDLWRVFDDVEAVRGISFEIQQGQVVGFIGANGAGKTTTMRIMVTLDSPTSGSVKLGGIDVVEEPTSVRRRVGWMPDAYGTYDNVTAFEYLDFIGRAAGLKHAQRKSRIDEVVAFTELGELLDRDMSKLSKGQSQRLCLARALLDDPEILILDEPAAGLDPEARADFKRLVRLLAEGGKTLLISSHILSELGEMCDSLLFIDGGKVIHQGTADSLRRQGGSRVLVAVEVLGPAERLYEAVALLPAVSIAERRPKGALLAVEGEGEEPVATLLRRLIEAGAPVLEYHRESVTLETAFIDLLEKQRGGK